MKFFWQKDIQNAATPPTTIQTGKKKGSRKSDNVNLPQPERVQMQLSTLRQNIEFAKDVYNPSWYELYRMFENTLTDAEVITQRRIAVNKIKAEKCIISKDGTDSPELSALFQKPWFMQFLEWLIDSELWGYRIVEFGQFDENGQFIDCRLFPVFNVYPHNKNIILNATDRAGIPYANDDPAKGELVNPYQYFMLELGDTKSLGLIEPLTREVIIKAFATRDWNEHSEKWGQPQTVVHTDAEGEDLNAIERGARNFARNRYMIVGTDDVVDKMEASNNGTGYLIYDKNIDKRDQYIAKIINGQYGTGAEKAFVGTAQVAENILNDFHHSRLRDAQNVINYELIPFLNFHGYPLQGCTGRFPVLDEKTAATGTQDGEPEGDESGMKPGNAQNNGKKKRTAAPW